MSWIEKNFPIFLLNIGRDPKYANSIIVADADKCEGYRVEWERAGIPFNYGVCIYLITKMYPYEKESRETKNGFVSPHKWVVANFERFKPALPETEI